MTLNRRSFLKFSILLPGVPSLVRAQKPQLLSGKLLGLTTLNKQSAERTLLFSLDLHSGQVDFQSLDNYRFGHSLEALSDKRWLAIPYGDDNQACLVLDHKGQVTRELHAPDGMGFGGHGVVLDDGNQVFLHYNATERQRSGGGQAVIVDSRSGKILHRAATPVIHGHDIIRSRSGQIILADDGVLESDNPADPLLLTPIKPALYYYSPMLALEKSVALPTNGCVVHIAEDSESRITGAVEQYVRRTEGGRAFLHSLLGTDTESYISKFDVNDFPDDLPLPGSILTVSSQGTVDETFQIRHQDPFDMIYNAASGTNCCVFTEANLVAWKNVGSSNWQYKKVSDAGLTSPFGLANIGTTPLIAVNDFDRGVLILDTTDMSEVAFFDVPTQGVKHLSFAQV